MALIIYGMMKRIRWSCAVGWLAAGGAGALLWAAAVRWENPLTVSLTAVSDSPWELGKAVFFALLAASPAVWRLGRGGSRSGLCAASLLGGALGSMLALAGLPPAASFSLAAALAMAVYGALLRRLRERALWATAVLALAAGYILLTLLHPTGGLFAPRGDVSALGSIPF